MDGAPKPAAETSLQQVLLRLVRFWTDQRCLLLPSCDFAVAAALLHPETFFRLLDADPWRSAYLQPVRRPLDGRRRDHPFRLAKHLQLQVVLKPAPPDLRAVYLRSLEAAGCELEVHDLRFAEWRLDAPALDGRGAGWHVLVDGLGVTRITWIRRLAGRELEPVAVELSYGLERLTMLLAGAPAVSEIAWAEGGPAYGALRRDDEAELSRYVFEVAAAGAVRQRLEALANEARRCLDRALARPAYELAVEMLHGVDVLAARGDLAASERGAWIARVGELVSAAAEIRLEARGRREAAPEAEQPAPEVGDAAPAAAGQRAGADEESESDVGAGKTRKKRKKKARRRPPKPRRGGGETADGG